MPSGFRAAAKYGYSNARVKALKSKLVSTVAIEDLSKLDSTKEMIDKLMDSEVREFVKTQGAVSELAIEFSLSAMLSSAADKLIKIVPPKWSSHIRAFVAKWDMLNICMMIKAKASNKSFDDFSALLIPSSTMALDAIISAYDQPGVEAMMSRLSVEVPQYSSILEDGSSAYRKKSNYIDAIFAVDSSYYRSIARSIEAINTESRDAANIMRYEIEAKNIMLIVRAKRYGISTDEIGEFFISGGVTDKKTLMAIMESGGGLDELPARIKSFDLNSTLNIYRISGNLSDIESGIKREIFQKNTKVMRYSVLSLATVLGYLYLKEAEVMRIREALNRKKYSTNQVMEWLYE